MDQKIREQKTGDQKTGFHYGHEVLNLYDEFAHGGITRREFVDRAAKFALGGLTAAALLETLCPNYALAEQVARGDSRLESGYVDYASPKGTGKVHAYMSRPAKPGKWPGVIVGHEAGGLNPYVEDVARRLALLNFIALAPDALSSVGGYPGDQEKGSQMQSKLDRNLLTEDFGAGVTFLRSHAQCTGKVGMVGFCFGGGIACELAVRMPGTLTSAVSYYGRQPKTEDVAKIQAPLLIHFAEVDNAANPGWPAFEAALKAKKIDYAAYTYPGTHHGFHNDSTPARYNDEAAKLSWQRTVEFLNKTLR
jgi:carboxymethylenebutenolidase